MASEKDEQFDHEAMPKNWGKWGDEDEIGSLNYMTSSSVLEAVQTVSQGEVFQLGIPIAREDGDPIWPTRDQPQHYMSKDKGHFESKRLETPSELESADDVIIISTHGTTHIDALGHQWYADKLYNGYDANTTKGGLQKCDIQAIAEEGVVGRGILLDMAAYHDVEYMQPGEEITLEDLQNCAAEQGTELEDFDVLLIRTGEMEVFYNDRETYEDLYPIEGGFVDEPGLVPTEELIEWFHDTEIIAFGTDTFANEKLMDPPFPGAPTPIHYLLLRNLGVLFMEILDLSELAESCREDGQYDFFFSCSPLKIEGGTASPINPMAIK